MQPRPCELSKYPRKHDVAEWLTIQTLCDSQRKGLGLKIQMGLYGSIGAQSGRGHISQKKKDVYSLSRIIGIWEKVHKQAGVLATGRSRSCCCWQLAHAHSDGTVLAAGFYQLALRKI